ncbi:hypothetical protein GN958_ATG16440 [Phytophthora infestans]|uniref:Uncharacterized protein n=1 Tax=Phytophthora infestans TaxID=4787 RepID=A0A8S9U7W3_PHYIN|nr:hypothetical protein GN958_ATG16440 [Phytophthora infestans]
MSTEDYSVDDLTGDWEIDAAEEDLSGVDSDAAQNVASTGASGEHTRKEDFGTEVAESAAGDTAVQARGLSVKKVVSLQSSISLLFVIPTVYTLLYQTKWQTHTIPSEKSVYLRCSSDPH